MNIQILFTFFFFLFCTVVIYFPQNKYNLSNTYKRYLKKKQTNKQRQKQKTKQKHNLRHTHTLTEAIKSPKNV
jgi:ribosomal protein S4